MERVESCWNLIFGKGGYTAGYEIKGNAFVLAITSNEDGGTRRYSLSDRIVKDKLAHVIFHEHTRIYSEGNALFIRTPANAPADSNAPLRGLMVVYRMTFSQEYAAMHLAVHFETEYKLTECAFSGLRIIPEVFDYEHLSGYSPDYSYSLPLDELKHPLAFETGMELSGQEAGSYIAIAGGGYMLMSPGAKFINCHSEAAAYPGDLRFFGEDNPLETWIIFKKYDNFMDIADKLSAAKPVYEPVISNSTDGYKSHVIKSGALEVELLSYGHGVMFHRLNDASGAAPHAEGLAFPLFNMKLHDLKFDREIPGDSCSGWQSVTVDEAGTYVRITLQDYNNGRIGNFAIVIYAYKYPAQNRIEWKTVVLNRNADISVKSITYPNCICGGDNISATIPRASVELVKNFTKRARSIGSVYPGGEAFSCQYFSFYRTPKARAVADYASAATLTDNGLYVAVHDPRGSFKSESATSSSSAKRIITRFDFMAIACMEPANSFTLPGTMVWQVFSGDWFDAAEIYREFVHKEAIWMPKTENGFREDTPEWFREMPFWVMSWMPNENPDSQPQPVTLCPEKEDPDPMGWYKKIIRLREALGVPIGYHVYNWHWVPFNNDNPHYFPAKGYFKNAVKEMQKHGIRVMPYIVGYSWDMRDDRGRDYRFQSEALPATAKEYGGEPVHRHILSKEPDGEFVEFARMCPTTGVWKNEVGYVVRKLFEDYGIDAIYLDVISAISNTCMDKTHNHLPGGGSYWSEAYVELIESLKLGVPEDGVLISESNGEVYTGALDGFLTWGWYRPNLVPAFPRIYGGKTVFLGRNTNSYKRSDAPYMKYHFAQSLLYGQQLGWIYPDVVDEPEIFPYLKKLAGIRWKYRKLFANAEMLRPPEVRGNIGYFTTLTGMERPDLTHAPEVAAGAWRTPEGNGLLMAVNTGLGSCDCTLEIRRAEYGIPESSFREPYTAYSAEGEGSIVGAEEVSSEEIRLHCRLEPESCLTYEWKAI